MLSVFICGLIIHIRLLWGFKYRFLVQTTTLSFCLFVKGLYCLLTGHAMWPAIILDESLKVEHKGLNRISGEKSVVVQFFGTHDFARYYIL